MKQKKTLQILLLVFAGFIVLYTGVNLYQKQQSSKEDSDQTMISDLKSLTSISYNNNGTTLSFIKQSGKWYYTKNKKYLEQAIFLADDQKVLREELKKRNLETEYVPEYAKEFVWENKTDILDGSLEHQKILYEEQKRRVDRLLGKVDVIVTDSPTILSLLYLKQPNEEFEEKAIKEFKANSNFNLFINRGKEFQQSGRIHSQEESIKIDDKIKNLLEKYDIYFGTYYHSTMDVVVDNIIKNYNNINKDKVLSVKEYAAKDKEELENELDICDNF